MYVYFDWRSLLTTMVERSPIRIPMHSIHKVTEEESADSLRALAFAVMIKRDFVSSVFKDADITSLMSFFHLKHSTLKKALNKALEMGLVTYVYRTDNKGKQHADLKAKPFAIDGISTVKFNVCDAKHGRIAYIKTNLKDLHEQYKNAESFQSINDVMDLLIITKALSLFKRHNKVLDCQLRQACLNLSPEKGAKLYSGAKTFSQYEYLYRTMQKEIPVGEINILNCGYSLDKILSRYGSFVSRYKLEKLIHKADQKHDYLFYTWNNIAYINQTERLSKTKRSFNQQEETPASKGTSPMGIFEAAYCNEYKRMGRILRLYNHDRFMDVDKEGNVINLYKDRGCYISKEHKNCLVMPMANTYYMQCDPFVTTGKKHRRVKRMEKKAIKCAIAPSVECHVNIDQLPF